MILSFPVPEPNSLLWILNAGITNFCVVLFPVVILHISFFVFSSFRSGQRQISSIFCFSVLCNVSFGLTPRKNPILASFWEFYFSIFRNARLA